MAAAGGILAVLLTLLEIAPLKINPWSALARAIGRALNRETLQALETLQQETREIRSGIRELQQQTRENRSGMEALQQQTAQLQRETGAVRDALAQHIAASERAQAEADRAAILQFSSGLLQGTPYTEADFHMILDRIDRYQRCCRACPDSADSWTEHAIAAIRRSCSESLTVGTGSRTQDAPLC